MSAHPGRVGRPDSTPATPELQEEVPFLAVTHGNIPRELFASSGPQGVSCQPTGAPRGEHAPRRAWGVSFGTDSDPGRALPPH